MEQHKQTLSNHHYTSEQLSGLTKEETKIRNILNYLSVYFCYTSDSKACFIKPNPNRRDLIETISKALTDVTKKSIDRRVIFKYIDYLLSANFIAHNPTSDITRHKHILPNNDTRYFLNTSFIESKFEALSQKITMGKSVCSGLTLDSFNKTNSQSQEEKKSNNSSEFGEEESSKVLSNLQKRNN